MTYISVNNAPIKKTIAFLETAHSIYSKKILYAISMKKILLMHILEIFGFYFLFSCFFFIF